MNNGVYFIMIALLVAESFKILIYANKRTCDVTLWTQGDVKGASSQAHLLAMSLTVFCLVSDKQAKLRANKN